MGIEEWVYSRLNRANDAERERLGRVVPLRAIPGGLDGLEPAPRVAFLRHEPETLTAFRKPRKPPQAWTPDDAA